jgi:hypothetical protein
MATFRDEYLNVHRVVKLAEVKQFIEAWRQKCNGSCSHGALKKLTPREFTTSSPLAANWLQPELAEHSPRYKLARPATYSRKTAGNANSTRLSRRICDNESRIGFGQDRTGSKKSFSQLQIAEWGLS